MKKIGLTGGIGSGKSTVAEIFRHLGIAVFVSDGVARKLQEEDVDLKKEIVEIFGKGIYSDGNLNRRKIAEIVFKDKKKLEQLNTVIHPAVANAFEKFRRENANAKYVLKEAAILFEIGDDEFLDNMIVVFAPDELRIKRVMERDKITREEVLERINNQMPQEEKVKKADVVIVNDGKELISPQVVAIHSKLFV